MAGQTTPMVTVKFTANFERNLANIESFLAEAEAPRAFDALLDELTDTVIPNLERLPAMGRAFLSRPICSVEASNSIDVLQGKLFSIGEDVKAMEYVLRHYLLLCAMVGTTIYLLSIRHHKQLSFDFEAHWANNKV
jgi:hypothetical protein